MSPKEGRTLTLLRDAAGSAPYVSQIRRFQSLGVRVVAADADPLSVGFFFADAACAVPRVEDPAYVDALLALCARERVDAFLPALDESLTLLDANRSRFEDAGTRLLLSNAEALRICTDKLATCRFLEAHSIPCISTVSARDPGADEDADYPRIVKPRRGRGSASVHLARTRSELEFFAEYVPDAVIQPFIAGLEYTVDVVADGSSEPCVIVPRARLAADSGISYKGRVSRDREIIEWTERIVRAVGLVGPANIQCFRSASGELLFSEINARLAGTSILSAASDAPLYEAIVALASGQPVPRCVNPADGPVMLRFWEEIFLSADEAARFGWGRSEPRD